MYSKNLILKQFKLPAYYRIQDWLHLGRIAAKPKIAISKIPLQLPPKPEASTAPWCLYTFPKDALNSSDLINARQHRASTPS